MPKKHAPDIDEHILAVKRPSMTREEWIARVAQLLAGEARAVGANDQSYAEMMATYYFDEPVAEGSQPETPEDAIFDEWQAGS